MFVGGAAYAVLSHIFREPAHLPALKAALGELPNDEDSKEEGDWAAGKAIASQITDLWDAGEINARIDDKPPTAYYTTKYRKHARDPLNDNQGFYGAAWAGQTASVTLPPELQKPVSPLGLANADLEAAFTPLKNPPPEESDRFLNAARQVKVLGRLPAQPELGPQGVQLTVGTFWAYDGAPGLGTPPRLYNQLIREVLALQNYSAADWARFLALCNLAMANASIIAWRGKYEHAIARPVLWLREFKGDLQDDKWEPMGSPRSTRPAPTMVEAVPPRESGQVLLAGSRDEQKFTPDFPAYPSGHATFGGAVFEVLRLILDRINLEPDGKPVSLHSDELDELTTDPFTKKPRPGHPVRFRTTEDLIDANACSRVALGVHWAFDSEDGVAAGRIVGQRVFDKLYKLN